MKRRAGKWCVKDAMMLAWIAVVLALICKMGHVSGTYVSTLWITATCYGKLTKYSR